MTKVQTILAEIQQLNANDLELVLREILQRLDAYKNAEAILDEYIGSGEGNWETDAQAYVNGIR